MMVICGLLLRIKMELKDGVKLNKHNDLFKDF
jgi:hypothetical protein